MTVTISTVTPVFNGSAYLPNLVEELGRLRADLSKAQNILSLAECIFVVDEAVDDSEKTLRALSEKHDWVQVITLSSNFGQHPATIAGMLYTSGDWVITLDEDLQHHPKYIPSLLAKSVEANSDICYAKSANNTHNSFMRDGLARMFKTIMSRTLDNPFTKDFNSFRVIRGEIARGAASVCRHDTYLDIALSWFTKRIVTQGIILYDDRNQNDGRSGYSFIGLVKHAKRMVMSSKIKFLRLAIPIGIIAFMTSMFIAVFMFLSAIMNFDMAAPKGWTTIILLVLSFGGITLAMLSIILESIGDLVLNTNGKPTFFVVDRSKDAELAKALSEIDYEIAPQT